MPVSDLHRQIAVLALAVAGEHGFALGGASAVLARGVISRPAQDAGLFTGQEHGVQAGWATKRSTPRKRSAPTGRSPPAAAGDRASHSHLPPARRRPACRVRARPWQLAEQPVRPSACPLVGDDHPVAAFLGRSHPDPQRGWPRSLRYCPAHAADRRSVWVTGPSGGRSREPSAPGNRPMSGVQSLSHHGCLQLLGLDSPVSVTAAG